MRGFLYRMVVARPPTVDVVNDNHVDSADATWVVVPHQRSICIPRKLWVRGQPGHRHLVEVTLEGAIGQQDARDVGPDQGTFGRLYRVTFVWLLANREGRS